MGAKLKNVKCVTNFGSNGIVMPRMRVELGEDLEIGMLVGLNENGLLVKATNANSGKVKALTAITTGSVADADSPRYFKGTNILKKGESHEIYPYFVIQNVPSDEVNFESAKYGDPVYLGVDGKLTTIAPSSVGDLVQVVGYVGDKIREEVVCEPLAVPATEAKGE